MNDVLEALEGLVAERVAAGLPPRAARLVATCDLVCGGDHGNFALEPLPPDPVQTALAPLADARAALPDEDPLVRSAGAIAIAFFGDADAHAALVDATQREKKAEVPRRSCPRSRCCTIASARATA